MHFKHLISLLPLSKAKLVWERITASRIAIIYIAFSVLNWTIQLVFQAQAYSINNQAADFLGGLIYAGNASLVGFFVLGSKLQFCDHVPSALSTKSCLPVWNGTISGIDESTTSVPVSNSTIEYLSPSTTTPITVATSSARTTTARHSHTSLALSTHAATVSNKTVASTFPTESNGTVFKAKRFLAKPQVDIIDYLPVTLNGQVGVTLQGFGSTENNITLDHNCLVALNWPVQTLRNTKREDVAFIAFQFWVLAMSLVAVLNESIPHIIATVLTHLSSTAWGGFQVYNTNAFHKDFKRLTTDGACNHVNLLPSYWSSRARAEIPSLAINVAALLVSCFLSFRLIKLFGWQTFKRVGASRTINRVYKLVLTLSIVIQLSLFFVVAAVSLWLDQLINGAIGTMATQSNVYEAVLVFIIILLIPWLLMGWFAARKELKFPMMVFLILSALYLVGWGLIFDSTTFRWTFVEWGFFGSTVTLSAILVLIGFVVGIMCRLNFNKGLAGYLNPEERERENSFIQPAQGEENPFDEKIEFPSTRRSIPTFPVMFEPSFEDPLSSQMRFQMGPRFFNQTARPFDLRVDTESITKPPAAHLTSTSSPEMLSSDSAHPLTRKDSQNSTSSYTSSSYSTVTMNEPPMDPSRWVIE